MSATLKGLVAAGATAMNGQTEQGREVGLGYRRGTRRRLDYVVPWSIHPLHSAYRNNERANRC